MMSNYEQPSTPLLPEKLPSIDKLPINTLNSSPVSSPPIPTSTTTMNHHHHSMNAYLPPPPPQQQQQNINYSMMYHQHMSPPLTPAVSPSSVLLDSMQFKRKFSVDVGPFAFGTNIPHPSSMHDQDAYRRSSCSAVSIEQQQQQDYHHFLNVQQGYSQDLMGDEQQQEQQDNVTKPTRRNSRNQLSGPKTQHKHACKYPYCFWSFKRYEHLKRHMLVHTGKRPHICHFPGCGKSFSRSDNFHAHYRTHTKKSNLLNGGGNKRKNSSSSTSSTAAASIAASAAAVVAASSNNSFEENRTPAYFAKQHQQSFDMTTSYQDMYGHRHSYSEESHDFHHSGDQQPQPQQPQHFMRHHFHQQQPQQFTGHHSPSLLNHDTNENPFYSTEDRFNNYNLIQQQQNYYPTTNYQQNSNESSIAAAVAVVAAAASSSSSSTTTTTTTNNTTNNNTTSRRSSSTTNSSSLQHKSHICPVSQCQRRFKRLEHLKRHMRIHTLERPFGCSFPNCHKTFSRSDNLSQHMKTHQRVEDRRRRQQRNDEPTTMKQQQHLPPLQQQQQNNNNQEQDNMMVGMTWHSNAGTVGC